MEENKKVNAWIVTLAFLVIFIILQFASRVAGIVASAFNYQSFDRYNLFAWISVHHLIQLLIVLIIIILLSKTAKFDFRFRLGNTKKGIKLTLYFIIILFVFNLVFYIVANALHMISPYPYPLNTRNVSGYLGFQLLLSGTEEILFRAFPIAILAYLLRGTKEIKLWRLNLPVEVLLASLIFSFAHINWSINPFTLQYDLYQLMNAFVLGVVYGIIYQKCDSILYPMLMHSISNVLAVGIGYLFTAFL